MINELQSWFLQNKRDLPFRKSKNPYFIWISEIMLQQTQVKTVIPYFERFVLAYPNVVSLANANEEEVLKMVEGLGYYRRFRQMHKAALYIKEQFNGIFPNTYEQVFKLPGVGPYTAGAIMSIAYNQPFEATDGNVIRVLTRIYAMDDNMTEVKNVKKMRQLNQTLIQEATPNIYTEAIMELGALICTPQNAKCDICPVKDFCLSFKHDEVNIRPLFSKKEIKKIKKFKTFIFKMDDKIALIKNEDNLLKNMYLLPQIQEDDTFDFEQYLEPLNIEKIVNKGVFKHVFTHQIWQMDVYEIVLRENHLINAVWVSDMKNHLYPLATAHKKIFS